MIKLPLFAFLVLSAIGSVLNQNDPNPPYWGGNPVFKVNVTMLNNNPIMKWNFTYYYDWTIKAERYEHQGPQADEMCLWANPPFTINDSCTVVFAKDGWSYVLYPKHNWCCKCGNSFGSIKYDWLQTNSKYIGQQTVNGYVCQHWTKQGLYLNHYYNTIGQLPVYFHQIKQGHPKDWTFDLKTYTRDGIDQSIFNPQCETLCGGTCKQFRTEPQQQQVE